MADPDLLTGHRQIAEHLGWTERQAKHRGEAGEIPTFKIGRSVCARRSTLNGWLAECEAKAAACRQNASPAARAE